MTRLAFYIMIFSSPILPLNGFASIKYPVEVAIENPIDEDEPQEIRAFLLQVVSKEGAGNKLDSVNKALSDLGRYKTIECSKKSEVELNLTLECRLTRFDIVRYVDFEGVPLLVLEKELKKRIPIKTAQIMNSEFDILIDRAKGAIRSYLERQGFFHFEIEIFKELVANTPAEDILFKIVGGSFVRVRNVTLKSERTLPGNSDFITKPFQKMCSNIRYGFEGIFQGTKACYDKEIEQNTIAEVEARMAELGFVEANLTVEKHFIEAENGPPKFMDLVINLRPGRQVKWQFDFVEDSQILNISSLIGFFHSVGEFFSRVMNSSSPNAKYPEDESILIYQLENALTFKASHSTEDSEIRASESAILEVLRGRGYLNATVETKKTVLKDNLLKLNFKIAPGLPYSVSSIKIAGTNEFSFEEISSEKDFLIQPRSAFSTGHITTASLEQDTNQIVGFFKERGYNSAKARPVLQKYGEGIEITYSVEPGERKEISQFIFENDVPALTKKFIKGFSECKNPKTVRHETSTVLNCNDMPFTDPSIENNRVRLYNLYQSNAYRALTFDGLVASKSEIDGKITVNFKFPVDDLRKTKVAEFLVDGNTTTDRAVIVRELGTKNISPGADLKPKPLDYGLARLRGYNTFSRLTLSYLPDHCGKTGSCYLVLQVTERPSLTLDLTLTFDSDRGLNNGLILEEKNLFGKLLQVKSELQLGLFLGRKSIFNNSLIWPRFLGTPMSIKIEALNLLYETLVEPSYERHANLKTGLVFDWTFFSEKLRPSIDFTFRVDQWQVYKKNQTFFADPTLSLSTLDGLTEVAKETPTLRGILKPGLSIVSVDDLFDPKFGFKLATNLALSGANFGSNIPFNIFSVEGSGYFSLGNFTLAVNLKLQRALLENPRRNWYLLKFQGDFETLGGIKGPRAYPLGGIGINGDYLDNNKGRRISTNNEYLDDDNGNPIPGKTNEVARQISHNGNFVLRSSLELRFPLINKLFFGKLNGAVFADFGFVGYCEANILCFDIEPRGGKYQFGASVGLGLRYVLPVGPITIDYGVSPVHQSNGLFGRESRINFQFGYPF